MQHPDTIHLIDQTVSTLAEFKTYTTTMCPRYEFDSETNLSKDTRSLRLIYIAGLKGRLTMIRHLLDAIEYGETELNTKKS